VRRADVEVPCVEVNVIVIVGVIEMAWS